MDYHAAATERFSNAPFFPTSQFSMVPFSSIDKMFLLRIFPKFLSIFSPVFFSPVFNHFLATFLPYSCHFLSIFSPFSLEPFFPVLIHSGTCWDLISLEINFWFKNPLPHFKWVRSKCKALKLTNGRDLYRAFFLLWKLQNNCLTKIFKILKTGKIISR